MGFHTAGEDQEPRPSDMCPECGPDGYTVMLRSSVPVHDGDGMPRPGIFHRCRDCRCCWWSVGEIIPLPDYVS